MIVYFDIPVTTVKPPRCRRNKSNTLNFLVVHGYNLDITEPTNVFYQGML